MAKNEKYNDNKCFVFSADGYEEITYAELCRRDERDKNYELRHFIPLHGMLMEVTAEQYREFYREQNRQRYLLERSVANGDISIDALLTENISGTDVLMDLSVDVAFQAEQNILVEKLKKAIQDLSIEEQLLLQKYYYDEVTETELARYYGISQQAVSKKILKLIKKLRKEMES